MINKLAKAVLKLILPEVNEHLFRVFKLDKLIDYMELPNEADTKIKKLEEKHKIVTEKLKDLEDMYNKVKKLRSL